MQQLIASCCILLPEGCNNSLRAAASSSLRAGLHPSRNRIPRLEMSCNELLHPFRSRMQRLAASCCILLAARCCSLQRNGLQPAAASFGCEKDAASRCELGCNLLASGCSGLKCSQLLHPAAASSHKDAASSLRAAASFRESSGLRCGCFPMIGKAIAAHSCGCLPGDRDYELRLFSRYRESNRSSYLKLSAAIAFPNDRERNRSSYRS